MQGANRQRKITHIHSTLRIMYVVHSKQTISRLTLHTYNKLTLCEAIIMIYHGISSSCTKFLEKNIFIVETNKVYPLGTVLVAWTPQTICIYLSIGTTIRGLGLSKQTKKTPYMIVYHYFSLKKMHHVAHFWTIPVVRPWFSNPSIPSKPAPQRRQMPRWRHCLHWWYTIQHGPAPAMRRLRSSGGRATSPRSPRA